jgi:hypothetical protein
MSIRDGSANFNQIMRGSLKYRNKPTVIDGIRFDSKAEAKRYQELELLQRSRGIHDLKRQVTFALYGKNGSPICKYRGDFMYSENDKVVVEDVKGMETPTFRLKQKLFNDNYPDIELRLIKK